MCRVWSWSSGGRRALGGIDASQRLLLSLSAWLLALSIAQPLLADVRFDAPALVACRDVTTEEFAADNPHQRLVEARVEVSALRDGEALSPDLQYVYRFLSPTGTLQFVDYEPRTAQATALAGNVHVEQTNEASKSLTAALAGGFQPFVQGTANADVTDQRTSQIRYELKPPLAVVLVAGTFQRGTGVYFQLLPSAETAWEGAREFTMRMRVPRQWRGDVLYVRCEAQQEQQRHVAARGVSRFVVGLYLVGDEEARAAAENLVLAEAALRQTVARQHETIQRRALPTVVHRVGALLDVYDPRIPDMWLDRFVFGAANVGDLDFVRYLPDDVRRLVDGYAQARRRLCSFSGTHVASRRDDLTLRTR
jgi:hypothetical protein